MSQKKKRLSQRDWLKLAMEALSARGDSEIRIDRLCKKLGVTKGSFYFHFEDRADFVAKLVNYWLDEINQSVIPEMEKFADQTPEARLLELMKLLHRKQQGRYDVPFRAWAAHDDTVARGVAKADRLRFDFIQRIFHDMGFRGAELEVRVRLFLVYQSAIGGMRLPRSELSAEEQIELRHAFLTRT